MNKGFLNILVVVLVVVLAGAVGYLFFKRSSLIGNTGKVTKPVIDLMVNPLTIEKNGSFVLTWSTQNAVSCGAFSPTAPDLPFKMDWSGSIELSGSRTYNGVPHDLTFELTCENSIGDSVFATATITVGSEKVLNETANWKTYRNEKYGFEVKYTPSYVVTHISANEGLQLISERGCSSPFTKKSGDSFDIPPKCILVFVVLSDTEISAGGEGVVYTPITVEGFPGDKVIIPSPVGYNDVSESFQFKKGAQWYHVGVNFDLSDRTEAENILNNMIASFKFTK